MVSILQAAVDVFGQGLDLMQATDSARMTRALAHAELEQARNTSKNAVRWASHARG